MKIYNLILYEIMMSFKLGYPILILILSAVWLCALNMGRRTLGARFGLELRCLCAGANVLLTRCALGAF